ncbi:acyl-protein thioesterase 2-like isoform X2 [Centruroides vittatus]|uniref:acyl-protein thioesterase 2-like isoform X2 n=1 Tax=Centruroides sculpturatus TaxID=218467 RepID=UPI000C6DEE78|nr:acyl-protein thioesterase 2-like isoform X2 [Centruroides sculpturatus]
MRKIKKITNHGWALAMESFKSPHIKFICPSASPMPVTLNGGIQMPSWFDLKTLDATGPEDEEGIKNACQKIHNLIEEETKSGIPSNRIMLGGFSQGGALAIYSALRYPKSLAGVLLFSCWLPLNRQFPGAAINNTEIPVLQCHGDIDNTVPHKWGVMTYEILKSFMPKLQFKTYKGMQHTSCEEEMKDAHQFIQTCLPPV